MSLNDETSNVLRIGTSIGLVIMAAGLLLSSFDFSDTVLALGILILIFTPVAGIAVSTKCLIQEKDRFWCRIAFLLIIIIIAGMLVSYLT